MSETLVLALGNPLRGDDGVGPAVFKALEESPDLPGEVVLLDDGGQGLMNSLLSAKYRRMFIVDAADFGGLPGAWKRFSPGDIAPPAEGAATRGTPHGMGLQDILEIAGALGLPLPEIIVYGVQPSRMEWSFGLSEPVRKAVPEICEAIIQEVSRPGNRQFVEKGSPHG